MVNTRAVGSVFTNLSEFVCVRATHLSLQRQKRRAQNVCFVRAEKFAHCRRSQKFCSGCLLRSGREEAHDINSNYTQVRACKTMWRIFVHKREREKQYKTGGNTRSQPHTTLCSRFFRLYILFSHRFFI
jgi:hypothetical protein